MHKLTVSFGLPSERGRIARFSSHLVRVSVTPLFLASLALAAPVVKDVTLISVTNTERISNGASGQTSISADRNVVAFVSNATNMTASSVTGQQLYLRNRSGGSTTLLSKTTGGDPANGVCSSPRISGDGSTVVFETNAKNLPSSSNADSAVYSANVSTGALTLLSTPSTFKTAGASNLSPDISNDGAKVVFLTNRAFGPCNGPSNVMLSTAGTLSCISDPANIESLQKSSVRVSADGSTAVIVANADGQPSQIYTVPAVTPAPTPSATPAPAVRITENSSVAGNGSSSQIAVNQDGTKIAFASTATNLTSTPQPNDKRAIYLYRQGMSPSIILVSKTSGGTKCNGESESPVISANGAFIAFVSTCRDLTSDNPSSTGVKQVFIYNVSSDAVTARASFKSSGAAIDGDVTGPLAIDNAGQIVFFTTTGKITARPSDTNEALDVFAYDSTCSSNSDNAGRTDCLDECPFDASKDADDGVCGCGLSDSDSDSDGLADCEDICPTDPLKTTSRGICGCGNSEVDADGNGQPDCQDPTPSFIPRALKFRPDVGRTTGVLTFPGTFVNRSVTFEVQFLRDGVIVQSGTTTKRTFRFRPLGPGRFTLRYRVKTAAVTSRWSKPVQINMRLFPRRR